MDSNPNIVVVDGLPIGLFKPDDGFSFDYVNYIALPAVGVSAAIINFTVPAGQNGVIKKVANNVIGAGFTDGDGSILWRIQIDDAFVRNYFAIGGSLGNPANPPEISGIQLMEQQVVQLIVSNISFAGGGGKSGGRLSGYFYPVTDHKASIWY
jgi:hypothetical protein